MDFNIQRSGKEITFNPLVGYEGECSTSAVDQDYVERMITHHVDAMLDRVDKVKLAMELRNFSATPTWSKADGLHSVQITLHVDDAESESDQLVEAVERRIRHVLEEGGE